MTLRHVLGISGGKDSTALAVYLKQKYPELDIEYYFCDTDKELPETYEYINKLEVFLGKPIKRIPEQKTDIDLFDYLLSVNGGFLPSIRQRWCTVQMKLRPFERYVGTDNVVSYVGIRGDEERSAYISKQPNIQSIMPFRKNIWSDEVILDVFKNQNINFLSEKYKSLVGNNGSDDFYANLVKQLTANFDLDKKVKSLLEYDVKLFNHLVFQYIKIAQYPLTAEELFPLVDNTDVLSLDDIISILNDSGIGLPPYYKEIEYEVDGKKGVMNRSRSGCYFCFFQQKIEWVWLYEVHPDLFKKAMEYEKDGYTWMQDERLEDLLKPARINDIKRKNVKRIIDQQNKSSGYLLETLNIIEEDACTICHL